MSRVINSILFLIFSVFAFLQFNDPDPIHWVFLYGMVAVISIMNVFGRHYSLLTIGMMIICALYAAPLIHSVFDWLHQPHKEEILGEMYISKPYIEESREFFGLVIAEIGLWYNLRTGKK